MILSVLHTSNKLYLKSVNDLFKLYSYVSRVPVTSSSGYQTVI